MLDFFIFLWGKTADEGFEEILFPSLSDSITTKHTSVKSKNSSFTFQTLSFSCRTFLCLHLIQCAFCILECIVNVLKRESRTYLNNILKYPYAHKNTSTGKTEDEKDETSQLIPNGNILEFRNLLTTTIQL